MNTVTTTQKDLEEFRQDMLDEAYRDAQIEGKMTQELDFCMESNGAEELADTISGFIKRVNSYGWGINVDDLKDYL